jgi:hypothetical protein
MVEEEFSGSVDSPFGVSLSREEISSAIQEVLPITWIEEYFEEIIGACADYVNGEETISVDIDLNTDNKEDAGEAITTLVAQKPAAVYDNLSEVSDWVDQAIIDQIPDQWSFDEEDIISTVGIDVEGILDDVRDWVSQEWSYTEVDLKDELTADDQDTLDDARDYIENGYSITEEDLRDEIDEGDTNDLDQVRGTINTVKTWIWALWLVPIILVLCAGLLIARNLKNKLLWFLGIMFVIFFIFYIGAIIGYFTTGEPEFADPADYQGFDAVMVEKGNEIGNNVIDTFISGIQNMCLYTWLAAGIIFIVVILVFHRDRLYPLYSRCRGQIKSWRNRNKVPTY